jgi:hypothetical protein
VTSGKQTPDAQSLPWWQFAVPSALPVRTSADEPLALAPLEPAASATSLAPLEPAASAPSVAPLAPAAADEPPPAATASGGPESGSPVTPAPHALVRHTQASIHIGAEAGHRKDIPAF